MIQFLRSTATVWCRVETDLPNSQLDFPLRLDNANYCVLMQRYLTAAMGGLLAAIRRRAYQQGWADAKAKKAENSKLTNFDRNWKPTVVGWNESRWA